MEIYLCRVIQIYFSQLSAFLVVLVAYSIICCDGYLHLACLGTELDIART